MLGPLLALMLAAHLQTPLPDGVVYRSHLATVKEMRWLEGRWWSKRGDNGTFNHPADWVRLRPIESGWLSINWVDKTMGSMDNGAARAPVTSYGGSLYVHIDVCARSAREPIPSVASITGSLANIPSAFDITKTARST